ncbi:hypothetical protein ZIOFF_046362 [Zingiber officinale]|uniref:Glutaredoxin domain-containing protein n=1 Tax=Zingiber officinale TaxID=94328 RepID=A0A8J5G8D5_ZINOF|nr:hypothetical protein ZIOFF_046362 [Zingiber officinale]
MTRLCESYRSSLLTKSEFVLGSIYYHIFLLFFFFFFSNWPTFPQVFINGEFVGGSDILLNMHQKGELKDLLVGVNPDGNQGRT